MSVIGYDIGNENCVIAVVKQRGVDVLLNDESKRETPAIVSFGEKQRFLGLAGAASATMNQKSTISQVKRLIGRKYKEPGVQNDLKLFPFETLEGPDGGISIDLQYMNEKHSFTPVQIMAMLFAHLKQITEKNLEIPVSDCVLGIPAYFTDLQRRSYLYAAEISGLKPLRLMHDGTATALGYGIYKNDFPNTGSAHVVFIDIGQCDTQITVAAFQAGNMKILSHSFDRDLGGRDFDEVLFRHFASKLKEEYNIDVYSNPRASIRLRSSCEKLKKVLSANAEAPLSIECLMDEKDVKGFIKREEFESLSAELFERIKVPCRRALMESGLGLDNIHTVELVGSGSRIPAITRILASLFKKEPRRTLNASECVARGCALQCAMLSPIFRVREYEVQDSFPFSVGLSSDEGTICTLSNSVLFPKGHPFPSVKLLTLHRSGTFLLEAVYADPKELPPGTSRKFSEFTIGPFQVSNTENAKVKVKVQLNLHGILTIESATLIEVIGNDSTTKNDVGLTSEKMEADNYVSSDTNAGDDTSSHSKPSTTSSQIDDMRRGKVRKHDIPVSETICGGMTKAEVLEAREKELELVEQDIKMEQTKERKNTLESYVYETRSKLLNTYRSFASESEKEGVSRNLQQTEDWLYEDGDDESEHVYTEKLEHLKKLVDPIVKRYKDEEVRAQAMRSLLNCVVDYRMAVGSLPASERDAVIEECNKAEQWLRERSQEQDSLPKNVDPVLWSAEIKRKKEALDAMCKHIMRSKASPQRSEETSDSDHRNRKDDMRVD